MKIFIVNQSKQTIGGGFTFIQNFIKGLNKLGIETVDCMEDCDVFFISGATLVTRDEFKRARELKKKIILRVDGIPEDWRNRGTGWSRLKDFAREADVVVYQSGFTKNVIGRMLNRDGVVIYNGVDKSIFKPRKVNKKFGNPSILHINFRGDPNKRWDEVISRFREHRLDNPDAKISFVGNYPKEMIQYNFGFERDICRHTGVINNPNVLASLMQEYDYIAFPSFADPCPNTLIEAMSCGLTPLWVNPYGGQAEITGYWDKIDWSLERMTKGYLEVIK